MSFALHSRDGVKGYCQILEKRNENCVLKSWLINSRQGGSFVRGITFVVGVNPSVSEPRHLGLNVCWMAI